MLLRGPFVAHQPSLAAGNAVPRQASRSAACGARHVPACLSGTYQRGGSLEDEWEPARGKAMAALRPPGSTGRHEPNLRSDFPY